MGRKTRRAGVLLATAVGAVTFAAGPAHAEPAGYWQAQAQLLPSATSDVEFPSFPIQVDETSTMREHGVQTSRITPYLAPWAHEIVPIDPNAVVDLTGAVVLSAPGGKLLISGHCIFAGEATATSETHSVAAPGIDIGDKDNGVTISPRLYVR